MSKEAVCSAFDRSITMAKEAWKTRRVRPVSNCYSTALETYKTTLEQRKLELQRQREYLMIVMTVAGTAALAWAPAAAMISGGSRALRGAVLLRAARIVGSRFPTSTTTAYRVLKNFTYGPVRDLVSGLASGPGKNALQSHIDTRLQATSSGSSTSGGSSRPQTELQHYNQLATGVEEAALDLRSTNQFLADTPAISDSLAQSFINSLYASSDFFQSAPVVFAGTHPLARRQGVRVNMSEERLASLRTDMEKALWASWCLTLSRTVQRCEPAHDGLSRVPNRQCWEATEYSNVSWAVQRRMQRLGIRIGGRGVSDYFGWVQEDSDVAALIRWAETHLRNQAARNATALDRYRD